jgi:hypothetical protein
MRCERQLPRVNRPVHPHLATILDRWALADSIATRCLRPHATLLASMKLRIPGGEGPSKQPLARPLTVTLKGQFHRCYAHPTIARPNQAFNELIRRHNGITDTLEAKPNLSLQGV